MLCAHLHGVPDIGPGTLWCLTGGPLGCWGATCLRGKQGQLQGWKAEPPSLLNSWGALPIPSGGYSSLEKLEQMTKPTLGEFWM